MRNILEKGDFLSFFGLEDSWNFLENSEPSTHSDYAVVSTDLNSGAIRSLLLRCNKKKDGTVNIGLKYLYHENADQNDVVDFLKIKCREHEGDIHIRSAEVIGQELDVNDSEILQRLSQTLKGFSNKIVKNNEWVNPVHVLDESGLVLSGVGKKAWPGLYVTGDLKNADLNQIDAESEPVYPAIFLPAILGVGPDQYIESDSKTHVLSLHSDSEAATGSVLKYKYKKGKKRGDIEIQSTIAIHDAKGVKEAPLYKIKTQQEKGGGKTARVKSLEYMGRKMDLSNHKAVSSILKIIRNTNRAIRAGDQALLDDLQRAPQERRYALPTELTLYTGAYQHLNKQPDIPQNGLMTYTAVGGNNVTPYVSDVDLGIGGNQGVVEYFTKNDDGKIQAEGLMVDLGAMFHDVFDIAVFNPAPYLRHKSDPHHKPDNPVYAILFTHSHEDHIGGLVYAVKCGYVIPPLIMNEMAKRRLKRKMSELKIEASVRDEILSKCYTINQVRDVNPQDPSERKTTEIDGVIIEQSTEVLKGKELGQYEYYPRLKIGSFEVRVGPMPHSDPGMMFDFITPAGSHRHTGDYKLDDTMQIGMPSLEIWAKGHQPDSMSADSIGATKEGRNPTEADVEAGILTQLHDHPERRHIFTVIGSNLARLTTLISALGKSDRKVLVVDGKAVEDLVMDADKVFGLREWAKRVHGVDVLTRSQKKKVAPYIRDHERDSEYAYLVSGSQDEAYSSINRAVRDWLPIERYNITDNDHICFLQGIIPTGSNAYRRLSLKNATEMFHGAQVMLPEIVEKEAEIILHSSGHNNREDMKQMIEWSGKPVMIPIHGGPDQLQAHEELAKEAGTTSIMLPSSGRIRIKKNKKVDFLDVLPSELIGIHLHTPSKDKFYLKGRFSTSVMPIKPAMDSDSSQLVDRFETIARQNAGTDSKYEMAKTLPISLSRYFNAQTTNGFLLHDMKFGIDKYGGDVFSEKNIFAIGAFDTETGGFDANRYLIREFGMMVEALDGEELDAVQLFQKIPDYRAPSPTALLVTDTNPASLREGLPAHEFVDQMSQSIKSLKEHSYKVANASDIKANYKRPDIKTLAIAHNTRFDSRFIAKEQARNLSTDTRPHQTRGIIAVDTRIISRSLAAYMPKKYNVRTNVETGLDDHTLEALCQENDVKYDTKKSHGALYDTIPCMALFRKQNEIAPDLVGHAVLNADSSTSHLLNDMMGMDTGFDGPHPVFSYVSPSAKKPKPKMGCFIGTMNTERYAVVFNLKYDPSDYLYLPPKKIVEMLADWDNDVFEVLDLRQQPIVVPARYGLRVKANGQIPKETLDIRAGVVKRHLNYIDPKSNWQTIAQKIDEAWKYNRDEIFKNRIKKNYPDLDRSIAEYEPAATPEDGAIQLLRMKAKAGVNPVYQHLSKHISLYLESIRNDDKENAQKQYKVLIKNRKYLEDAVDTLNNVHFDIAPDDLSEEDRVRIQSMRDYIGFINYQEVLKGLQDLETPEVLARYVGEDKDKKKLLKQIKSWAADLEYLGEISNTTKEFVRPYRNITRVDGNECNPPMLEPA